MAYGKGKSRLFSEIGQEQAFELGRYNRELSAAEGAYEQDVESSSLWQTLFGAVGAGVGFFSGGGPSGALKGWQIGGEAGKWGQRGFSGYEPEDYAISTDPGKFDVSQKYDFEDVNRQFESADKSRFWKDVTSTGITLASMLGSGAKGGPGSEMSSDLTGYSGMGFDRPEIDFSSFSLGDYYNIFSDIQSNPSSEIKYGQRRTIAEIEEYEGL